MHSSPENFAQGVALIVPQQAIDQVAPVLRAAGAALLSVGVSRPRQAWDHGVVLEGALVDLVKRTSVAAREASLAGVSPVEVSRIELPGLQDEIVFALPPIDRRDPFVHLIVAPATASASEIERLATLTLSIFRAERRFGVMQRDLDSLSNQLADTYEELTLIYQLSSGMRINRGVEDFFLQASMDVMDVMQVRGVGVLLCDAAGRIESNPIYGEVQFAPHAVSQFSADLISRFRTAPRALLVNDLSTDPAFCYLSPDAYRMMAVPLMRQDQVLGALFAFDKAGDDFNTQDSKLLGSIANETAVFLENATLFADARGLMMGLLHSLTSAVDAKDAYTCGHSQRVALFAKEITRQARLPDAFAERVYMAGLLHDVGKIGVPEEVLRKPGKLTDEEFGLMKKHVEIGAKILRDVKQVEDLIPGVLHHHERYDGRGYPHNLSGQSIPLMGRILCVADCFDAMTSNRTYRRALPLEVALMEIRRCSGTQFDPALADAFLQIGESRLRELIHSVEQSSARPVGPGVVIAPATPAAAPRPLAA
jgi:putative nucleotidyltransferase with HDIG domain